MNLIAGNVKTAMKDAGAKSADLWQVPIDQLRVIDGFNVRSADSAENMEHIATLAHSILANGFMSSKPLAGYVAQEGDKQIVYIIDGHHRFEAVKSANVMGAEIHTVPVVVSPRGTNMEDLTVGLAVSNEGKPLTPMELGEVCKRLVGFGWDESTIAKRIARTPARVVELLNLIGAPLPIREAVIAGDVSAATAIATMKKEGSAAVDSISAGVQRAKAQGKKKATKKDIQPDRVSPKAVVRELVEWAKISEFVVPDDLKPILTRARKALAG